MPFVEEFHTGCLMCDGNWRQRIVFVTHRIQCAMCITTDSRIRFRFITECWPSSTRRVFNNRFHRETFHFWNLCVSSLPFPPITGLSSVCLTVASWADNRCQTQPSTEHCTLFCCVGCAPFEWVFELFHSNFPKLKGSQIKQQQQPQLRLAFLPASHLSFIHSALLSFRK